MRLIDAENFEAFDSTLPIQIAPKGMRARKIASFFYAEIGRASCRERV